MKQTQHAHASVGMAPGNMTTQVWAWDPASGPWHLQPLADELDHFVFLGEFAGLEFGIGEVPVETQFETAPVRRDQFEAFELRFVLRQDFGRQTDGLRLVASLSAIFQGNFHVQITLLKNMESTISFTFLSSFSCQGFSSF